MPLEIIGLQVRNGSFELGPLSFSAGDSDYLIISGPNGSGKTTLLETICGLKTQESGQIFVAGRDVSFQDPAERQIAYVPQDLALFPTMTVGDQIAFPLQVRKMRKDVIANRVNELLSELQLVDVVNRKPNQLSGGEQQRVALARALSFQPALLCLDEPLSALDDASRESMIKLLQDIRQRQEIPIVHVTHDKKEAERLSTHRLQL